MQEVKLHLDQRADFHVKEAFKTLRSNVEFCGSDVKVIAVTSCTPHEGKTSVAMELARSFAEAGNRTLLIDADMRKSVLVGRYKTGVVKYGLSHCLIGKYKYTDAMCQTDIPRLYMFFSGPVPPNPSELLGSERFVDMLNMMRTAFDYIIIDTPPLGSVIDAAVVAKRCDGTVLVVENNAISYRFVQRVKEQLDKSGSRILGVVLNKVDLSGKGYYGHYGRYYGKYYGKYGYDNDAGSVPEQKRERQIDSAGAGKAERQDRLDRVERPVGAAGLNRVERPAGAAGLDRLDRSERAERLDRLDRSERAERLDRLDRSERAERLDRLERLERTDRLERLERSDRLERLERPERPGRLTETEKKTVSRSIL